MKNVALLRGINVGGHKKILMKDLRELLSKSQLLKNIETYIQSGNIVFESAIDNKEELEQEIYTYIYKKYSFEVPVQVYTMNEWAVFFKNNPFLSENALHINGLFGTFLGHYPSEENISKLVKMNFHQDSFKIRGKIIYTHYMNGAGKSKMTNTVFEKVLGVSSTSRNWKTITKIQDLLNA